MLTNGQMSDLGKTYGIAPDHCQEFLKLANEGVLDNHDFGRLLVGQNNYKRVYKAILTILSKPVREEFRNGPCT